MKLNFPIKVSIIYLILGLIWIYFSDKILLFCFGSSGEEALSFAQTYKGFFFIIITTILLFLLTYFFYRKNKESKLKLVNAAKIAKIGFWEVDLNNDENHWSDEVYKICEKDRKTFKNTSENIRSLVHPDDLDAFVKTHEEFIYNNKEIDHKFRILINDNVKWIHEIGEVIYSKKGKPIYSQGTIQDITDKKKVEMLLDKATDLAKVGSWEVDLKSNTVFWSPMTKRIYEVDENYTPEPEKVIKFFKEGYSREKLLKESEKAIKSNGEIDLELEIITAKNNNLWVRLVGNVEFDKNKNPIRIYGSLQDIDRTKRAELQSLKFKEVVKTSPHGIIIIKINGDIEFMNSSMKKELGIPESKKIKSIVDLDLYDQSKKKEINKYFVKGQTWEGEISVKTLTGKIIPIYFSGGPINGIFNKTEAYFGIHTNLEEIKKKEHELFQANERFKKIAQATNDAIWDWDIKNNSVFWGDGYKNLFGPKFISSEKRHEYWKNAIHPEDREKVLAKVKKALENTSTTILSNNYRLKTNEGKYAEVIDRSVILRDQKGTPYRILGAVSDVTKQKQYEKSLIKLNHSLGKSVKDLERANKELEQFAFITSHDLQEPLRMIKSFVELIDKKYSDKIDEKGQKYIYFVKEGTKNMKQIIDDLLQYSRAIKLDEPISKVDLNQLIDDYKSLRISLINDVGADIKYRNIPDEIYVPKAPFTQVIHCLLDNAIKYHDPTRKHKVIFNVVDKKEAWIFEVKDNGIGIAEDYHDKIFDMFQRLHNKEKYDGSGMGLALVKRNVENWGGSVWLKSKPGEGSSFHFSVPKM